MFPHRHLRLRPKTFPYSGPGCFSRGPNRIYLSSPARKLAERVARRCIAFWFFWPAVSDIPRPMDRSWRCEAGFIFGVSGAFSANLGAVFSRLFFRSGIRGHPRSAGTQEAIGPFAIRHFFNLCRFPCYAMGGGDDGVVFSINRNQLNFQ